MVTIGQKFGNYTVIANYRNEIVLAKSDDEGTPEPFVIWNVDADGNGVNSGQYFTDDDAATEVFRVEMMGREPYARSEVTHS